MSTNKVNVGVIGFGMSARVFHCPLVTSSPFLHLYGVVERRSDKSKEVYPWVQVFKSTEDLFANKEVDLVVITTPNESHYTLALEAMKAGKHVVVEKPFTVTSKEAEDLAQVAKETNRICSVYQNRRWDGDFLTVKKLIKANHLGRLVEYESHFDRFRNFVKAGWREQDDQPGAGMVYDLGAHLIDQALHLFGMPKTVFATISNQRQLKESNVADDFTIILGYDNAFKVLLRSSMLSRHTPVLRFNLRGMNGSFRKEYLDVQEDQLKSGKVPSDGEYGVESRERYGTIDSDIGGVHLIGTVETEKGDYLSFYNNVAESILKSDPEHLAVKPQDGVNCIRIIELAQQSNDEGPPLSDGPSKSRRRRRSGRMAALGSKAMAFVASKKDTVVSLLLFGSFAAMAVRSNEQQRQIEALEAEKSALRASNAAVSSAMWSWRQHLFHLAESPDCSSASAAGAAPFIPLARLRAIYGEDDPSASDLQQGQEDVAEESITIA